MSPAQRHLVIFARHPRLGQGKRRLAAQIGDHPTHQWYRAQLAALTRRLSAPERWRLVLALDRAPARLGLAPQQPAILQDWPNARRSQPAGDLGQRMLACLAHFAPKPVVLIGSDVLGIEQSDIAHLFQALQRPGSVLAPAKDGGFWALGHRGPALSPRAFDGVLWSRPDTGERAQIALKARMVSLLKSDLDELEMRPVAGDQPGNQPADGPHGPNNGQPRVPLMPQLVASHRLRTGNNDQR